MTDLTEKAKELLASMRRHATDLKMPSGGTLSPQQASHLLFEAALCIEALADERNDIYKITAGIIATYVQDLKRLEAENERLRLIASDVVSLVEEQTNVALLVGLPGTSEWDKLAGTVDLYGLQDRARVAL